MTHLQIGISACLLGAEVRFNGGHKKNHWICNKLAQHATFHSFCPEVGIGLPIPRPTLRLITSEQGTRAVDSDTQQQDVTDDLRHYADQQQANIAQLDGYILMQGSPSCGMERVKLYAATGIPEKSGVGTFAERMMQLNPNLPVEEAGRLEDPLLSESFFTRLFLYHEWRTQQVAATAKALIAFHTRHKFLLLLHNQQAYRDSGRLLSNLADKAALPEIADAYLATVMKGLKKTSSKGHRINTLLHLFGYLKGLISPAEKTLLLEQIEQYQSDLVPYVVPLNLLRHYAKLYSEQATYLNQQSVWHPYPSALAKRFL